MPLVIVTIQLGPMENNSYLIADPETHQAAVIDPSFESEPVLEEAAQRGWTLTQVWLTHAHFDHIAGVRTVTESTQPHLPVGLHPADLPLWKQGGGARFFGFQIDPGPKPTIAFSHGQTLRLGSQTVEVRHTPGHTDGHVVFYAPEGSFAVCGDLIFYHGVGRTDLPGGSHQTLLQSIREHILTLPPTTRLLCGHGPETTVEEEKRENPFL